MSTVAGPVAYSPQDLLTMPDGGKYELVDGSLVELNMSYLSSYVAGQIYQRLKNHCDSHQLGWVTPEGTSFRCFPDAPAQVRRPDTAFISLGRLSAEQAKTEGHCSVAPDLAIEVVSPGDTAFELDEKVDEYLAANVALIWVINPEKHTIRIHRRDGTVTQLREADTLSGEQVIPGFQCRVSELFQLPGSSPSGD